MLSAKLFTIFSHKAQQHIPFPVVAPVLVSALLLGTCGGFALATVLTLAFMLNIPLGPWWTSTMQAHGHIQLFGWAGLFVIGVALYFLPRLRGEPLVASWLVPWVLGAQVTGLILRILSQPLTTITGLGFWHFLFIISSVLECFALISAVLLLGLSVRQGPPLTSRLAFRSIFPMVILAFTSLAIASMINLVNVVQTPSNGLIQSVGDSLSVTVGLFGFLVPMALAMSAQSLPMYAGLESFPRRILWPLAALYIMGLLTFCVGLSGGMLSLSWSGIVGGFGMLLIGMVILTFLLVFLSMMRKRGKMPARITRFAPEPQVAEQTYKKFVATERNSFGPFVPIIASAYLWAILASLLLIIDGFSYLLGLEPPFILDAIRHSLALGFITLLICGIAPRMITGFSGGHITSPRLVTATLWLGNLAVLLRVGSLLAAPLLTSANILGVSFYALAFGLSGPIGLALSICLTINLWPALKFSKAEKPGSISSVKA